MPTLKFAESGGDATQDFKFWTTTSTGAGDTLDISTAQPRTGPRSIRIVHPSANATYVRADGIGVDGGTRAQVPIYLTALPSGDLGVIAWQDSSGTSLFRVIISSTGVVKLVAATGTLNKSSGSAVIAANRYQRIVVSHRLTNASTDYAIKVFVDDVQVISATHADGTLGGIGTNRLQLGVVLNFSNFSGTMYIDDVVVYDVSDLANDAAKLVTTPNYHVTAKMANSSSVWASNTGYATRGTGAINERPPSTTNGQNITGNGTGEYDTAIEAAASGDLSIPANSTYDSYVGWIFASGISTDQIVVMNVATTKAMTTTATLFTVTGLSSVYPQDASNKTIGIKRPNGNATDSIYGDGGLLVIYIQQTATRSAAIDATGAITVAGQRDLLRSAAFGATGAIAVAGQRDLLRSAAFGATGAIAVAGLHESERSAALDAAGAITVAGQRDLLRSTALGATGGIAVAGQRDLLRSTALDATVTISSFGEFESPFAVLQRAAALDAAGTIVSSGVGVLERAATLDATATVLAQGQRDLLRSTAFGVTASVDSSASFFSTLERASTLDAAGAVTTAGQRELLRSITIDGSAGIASNGGVTGTGQAALNVTATISSSGQRALLRAAAVDAAGSISTSGLIIREGAASFTVTGDVSSSGEVLQVFERSAELGVVAGIDSDSEHFTPGINYVFGAASLVAAAIVDATASYTFDRYESPRSRWRRWERQRDPKNWV